MKQLNHYSFTFIIVALILASCGKNSVVGPIGPQGPVGPAGPKGADGQNGSAIYSGTTTPLSTIGAVGDFYLNETTGLLYGPKTASGWGYGFSLIGATGATGAAGSQTYSGSGAPPSSTGVIGDYYLDKTNYLLYGPKTVSGWDTPINLQAPQGNANVKTDVFTIGGSQWIWNSQYAYETSSSSLTEYLTRYYVRSNNTITQDVLNKGLILVYFTPSPINNPNEWAPLPYDFDSSLGYFFHYVYVTDIGKVTFHYFFTGSGSPAINTYNDEIRKFKIVAITGQTGIFMLNHVNLNNYREVIKASGLWQQDKLDK